MTFKGAIGTDYVSARAMMCSVTGMEALRFGFLLESDRLMEQEKERYRALIKVRENGEFGMSDEMLVNAILTLTQLLEKHYGRQVILLINEYDLPLDKAYQMGYYEDMVNLIWNMFAQALKTNNSLKFAVLTGYLTQREKTQEKGNISAYPDWGMEEDVLTLAIPNREIRKLFMTQIYTWFQETARKDTAKLDAFCMAFRMAMWRRLRKYSTHIG